MHGETKNIIMTCLLHSGNFFLQTDYAKQHVPDWHGKLEDIQSICDNNQNQNYIEKNGWF